MYLTDFQKELIEEYQNEKITDIYSFLNYLNKLSYCKYYGPKNIFTLENIHEKQEKENITVPDFIYTFKINDFDYITRKLHEFMFLNRYLERQNLLRSIRLSSGGKCSYIPVIDEQYKNEITFDVLNNVIGQIVFEGYRYSFKVSFAVKDFVKRGYLTDEEYRFKHTSFWTRIIAMIALFGVVLSAVFQIVYSGKERDVYLRNSNVFPDTSKVLIINPSDNTLDTLNLLKKKNK